MWRRWYIPWKESFDVPLQSAPSRNEQATRGGAGGGKDLAEQLRGRSVTRVGRLASMTAEQFEELTASYGARYTSRVGRGVAFVVLGEGEWPMTPSGLPLSELRQLRIGKRLDHWQTTVLTERQFLDALGLYDYRDQVNGRYSLATLSQILNVPPGRIRSWVLAGLLAPLEVDHGVWYFDFRQVTATKTILDLLGHERVTLARLRKTFERLHTWLPDVAGALHQIALLERDGELLVRLRSGALAAPDGQLRFEFGAPLTSAAEPIETGFNEVRGPLKLVEPPRTALEWAEQGAEQEQAGYLAEASESYRQALLVGGPDAAICFSLANTLQAQGKLDQAAERFLQAVEIDPKFTDAWNNLGVCFAAMDQPEAACDCFQRVLNIVANDARALWNLADTLDELGRRPQAREYWQRYLHLATTGDHATHARQRVAGP
jgi:tetratricopeptide (TPR) repeat protein